MTKTMIISWLAGCFVCPSQKYLFLEYLRGIRLKHLFARGHIYLQIAKGPSGVQNKEEG
jgi:hypothetical protein